jgi:uncharacterized membrane protein YkgB
MGFWQRFGDWLGLLLVVAVIFVLARPRSKAAELVDALMDMLTALVRRTVDLASTG